MAENNQCESNTREIKYKADIQVGEALKGLKALTREAKKATTSLKDLEEQHRRMSDLQEGEENG